MRSLQSLTSWSLAAIKPNRRKRISEEDADSDEKPRDLMRLYASLLHVSCSWGAAASGQEQTTWKNLAVALRLSQAQRIRPPQKPSIRRRFKWTGRSIVELPDKLAQIPSGYFTKAMEQGSLQNLQYETYESFSYEQHSQKLNKRAVVYLPYGYSEDEHDPVVYLMHGGWSDETT